MDEQTQPQFPGIGREKITKVQKERQVQALLELSEKRGVEHTVAVARALNDPYVLDRFHDELAKMAKLEKP